MHRSRMAFALGLVGPLLVLGGCSGNDPQPKIAPPESAAPTSDSPSQSGPVAPTLPAAAKRHDAAGAAAFVNYWVEVVNFAQATGDTSGLGELNDDRCVGCRGMVKAITRAYNAGGHIEGGTLSIGRLRQLPLGYGADWAGFAKGTAKPQIVYDGSGKKVHSPGGAFHFYAYTGWSSDGWRMRWLRTPTPA